MFPASPCVCASWRRQTQNWALGDGQEVGLQEEIRRHGTKGGRSTQWFKRRGSHGEWGSPGVLKGPFCKQREQLVAVLEALGPDQIGTRPNVLEPGNA